MSASTSTSDLDKWNKFKSACDSLLSDTSSNAVVINSKKQKLFKNLLDYKSITTKLNLEADYIKYDQLLSKSAAKKTGIEEVLMERTDAYFRDKLSQEGRVFVSSAYSNKTSGVQQGKIVTIKSKKKTSASDNQDEKKLSGDEEFHTTRFFIKTHQHGSSNTDPRAGNVDPKELLIYKILEYSQIGEHAHFLNLSDKPGDVVIMTEDAASADVPGSRFVTFTNYEQDQLKEGKPTPREVEESIVRTELISKIFHLDDLITNGDNFGCVQINNKINRWSIVDFRIDLDDFKEDNSSVINYRIPPNPELFSDIRNDILEKNMLKKIMIADCIVKKVEFSDLSKSIEKSIVDVSEFVRKNPLAMGISKEVIDKKIDELEKYGAYIIQNMNDLQRSNYGYISDEIKRVRETGKSQCDSASYQDALKTYKDFLGFCELYDHVNNNIDSKKLLTTTLSCIGSTELLLNNIEGAKSAFTEAIKLGENVLDEASINSYRERLASCKTGPEDQSDSSNRPKLF